MAKKEVFVALAMSFSKALAVVTSNGAGRLPPMGWNSYNAYGGAVTREKFVRTGEQFLSLGLKELGYEYVNVDEGWQSKIGRDNHTLQIMHDEDRFPGGMAATAQDIHALGLKMGIYSDSGTHTCGLSPGSLYYEEIDAATWAAWEMDYVKIDNCNVPDTWAQDLYNGCHPDYDHPWGSNGTCADRTRQAPPDFNWTMSSQAKRFKRMQDALVKQNRTILHSICNWGQAHVEEWGNSTGSVWRMTDDINANWVRIVEILAYSIFHLNTVGFWGHNDMDMLQVGNGILTLEESRSHFALWAALKSPLLISTPLENLTSDELAILKNRHLIAFNQDAEVGEPAVPYKWGINADWSYNKTNPAEYYSGISSNGTLVLMFNPLNSTENKTASWAEVPGLNAASNYRVTDVWSDEDLGCKPNVTVEVGIHDTAALLVGEEC